MTITITNLRLFAYHGALPQEHVIGGEYVINLSATLTDEHATQTDDLSDTVNYAELVEIIKQEMATPSKLIEHVCGRINRHILTRFPQITQLTTTIQKQNPPIPNADIQSCGIQLTTTQTDLHPSNAR